MASGGSVMKVQVVALVLALLAGASAAQAQETPKLQFVQSYIRALGELEEVRALSERELKDANSNQMANCVRHTESMVLVLGGHASAFQKMKLGEPHSEIPPLISQQFAMQRSLYGQLHDICVTLSAGPKPGVDYSKLAATAPDITAKLRYAEKNLEPMTGLVFTTLIDMRTDAQGQVTHLVLTKAERQDVTAQIDRALGSSLSQVDANAVVSAALLLRELLQTRLSADDPW